MAPLPGQYLVNNTVNDCNALLLQLEQARRLVTRITERMKALGEDAADTYEWPMNYTKQDFLQLYWALGGKPDGSIDPLPDSIVENSVRDALYKLVSSIQ